ncbi:hypothetical protein LWI28_005518 [Acer negundo]|uniref:Uncharacterized protein n=1 Tax=Acer negundo TaxID=4023 RepID=A0AAD5IYT8_ACENE|nr:hypothetical protein LWI28_005518 [Acer negundo]
MGDRDAQLEHMGLPLVANQNQRELPPTAIPVQEDQNLAVLVPRLRCRGFTNRSSQDCGTLTGHPLDIGVLIKMEIHKCGNDESNKEAMGFPSLITHFCIYACIDLSADEMKEPSVDIGINKWFLLYPSRGLTRPRGPKRARAEAEDSESEAEGSEPDARHVEGVEEDVNGHSLDIGVLIKMEIHKCGKDKSNKEAIGFPSLITHFCIYACIDLSADEMKEPSVDIEINKWFSLYPSRGLTRPKGPKRARAEAEDSESEAEGSEPDARHVEGAEEDVNGHPLDISVLIKMEIHKCGNDESNKKAMRFPSLITHFCIHACIDLSVDEIKEPSVDIRINKWFSLYPSRGLTRPRGSKRAQAEAEDSESEAEGSEPDARHVEGAEEDVNVRLLTQMLKVMKATYSE